jgi:hypothetical protein
MLVKIFPTTPKAHSNSFEIFSYGLISFSVKKSFNIQELFAPQVQTPWNQAHAHLLIKSFPKTPRTHNLKHPGLVDLITTKPKQNKQSTFLPS